MKLDPSILSSLSNQNLGIKRLIDLENNVLKKHDQVDIPVRHDFSKGVYARTITIPAGLIITGEIHKYENLNILSKGSMRVLVGDTIEEVEAPFITVSPPGTKRIAYTLSECVWTCIHGTNETNLNKIKDEFIAADEKEWLEFCGANQLRLF